LSPGFEAADADRPPRRLVLGSVAYNNIERTLADRLDAIRGQKALVFGADYPAS
jgi:hypothetical protein